MPRPVFASVGDYDNTNWICVHFFDLPCQNKSPLSDRVTVRKCCSLRDIKQTSVVFVGLRLGLRMDFLLCPILRPNILGHILFK